MSKFRFGHSDQYEVGSIFDSRKALSDAGIHGPPMHGIWGRQREGACSIVMSGGYEDDIDEMAISYQPCDDGRQSVIIPLWHVASKERTEHFRNKTATRLTKALTDGVIGV